MPWIQTRKFLASLPPAVHGCAIVMPDPSGRVLLVHDAFDQDRADTGAGFHWWLPGGMLDHDELPTEAVLRELHEETGLTPSRYRALGVNYQAATGVWPAVTDYYFAADPLDHKQASSVRLSPEHDTYRFVEPEGIPAMVSERRRPVATALLHAWSADTTCILFNGNRT